ncbi:MAG TPA: LCP family protein [Ktedonobacterales bacterium]
MSAPKRPLAEHTVIEHPPHLPARLKALVQQRWSQPGARKRLIFRGMLLLLVIAICLPGTYALAKLYRVYSFLQGTTSQTLPHINSTVPLPSATALPGDFANLDALNVLLLGSDTDTKFADGRVLTQTVMLVRLDLKHKQATLVSLPRDLWVPTDQGMCCAKLDEISLNETDGANTPLEAKLHGFAHTIATVEADFHIPIQAYAWVGLDGFIKVIDSLGGVDVDVLHPIEDDSYPQDINSSDPYAYKRLDIPAGPQHLDGRTALEYVRSRHGDLLEDVGRASRQQGVLLALKKKLDNPAILTHLDDLAADLQGSVLTSFSLPQVLSLANILRQFPANAFAQMVLGLPDYGSGALVNTPEGVKWVQEPNWAAIHQTLSQIFPQATS